MVIDFIHRLKAFKKDIRKELKSVAWDPTRWWDWCLPEDDKKEIEPTFTDESQCKVGKG